MTCPRWFNCSDSSLSQEVRSLRRFVTLPPRCPAREPSRSLGQMHGSVWGWRRSTCGTPCHVPRATSGWAAPWYVRKAPGYLARDARAQVEDRARTVGVRAALPLGLCLLPAFLLIGIVPVIGAALQSLVW